MSGPQNEADTRNQEGRPISVAELLARNGTIGSPPVSGRRRRRRGNSDAVTVAELTGEIPIIRDTGEIPVVRDEEQQPDEGAPDAAPATAEASDAAVKAEASDAAVAEAEASDAATNVEAPDAAEASEPAAETAAASPEAAAAPSQQSEPDAPEQPDTARPPEAEKPAGRFPRSWLRPQRGTGPQRSEYPRPIRLAPAPNGQPARREAPEAKAEPAAKSDAEQMRPDPVDSAVEIKMDDADVSAELPLEDSAYVRSVLRTGEQTEAGALAARPGGPAVGAGFDEQSVADFDEDQADLEADLQADVADGPEAEPSLLAEVWGGTLIVLQSMLAVVFGAGLFIAFDQLWRWNNVAALVLTVLVTLGLVAAVQVVRKTVDIVSTLIAVAVGLLVTLGPLALHAT